MKVLMIPSWYPTAEDPLLGTFYKEQAEALAARGVEVAVLYVNVSGDLHFSRHGVKRTVENGVLTYRYTRLNLTPKYEKGRCAQRTAMLERLYRRLEKEWGRPDVVNLRSSLQGYEAVRLCRRHKLPLFFMEHSSYVVTEGEGSVAQKRLQAVMAQAAVNACVGSTLYGVLSKYDTATRMIPDFVDGDAFTIKDTPAHEGFLFRAMGQLRAIKGHDTLIRAFARALTLTDRPMRLEIAGAGPLRNYLQDIIDGEGIGDRCALVGQVPRDQVVDYMNGCDAFVCSSRREMLSCVLMECAACGRPALATACGGPQDIVTPETGVLVPPEDEEAMAAAMVEMLDRAAGFDRARIREVILEKFGIEAVCRALIAACADAAKEGTK